MKLKVPTSNLVKFNITRARFDINKYQDSRNFTQNLKMCAREKTFRDMDGIFKKINYIHVCVCARACWKEKKKERTCFSKRKKKHSVRRGKKQFKQGNFLNTKVLKLCLLLGKVPSHF